MSDNIKLVCKEITQSKGMKAKIIILVYRLATLYRTNSLFLKLCAIPFLFFNKVLNEWIFNVELPYKSHIGYGLRLYHPQCIVISKNVVIGKNCTLKRSVTITGIKDDGNEDESAPKIGDNVSIDEGVIITGDITITSGSSIKAKSIIPPHIP